MDNKKNSFKQCYPINWKNQFKDFTLLLIFAIDAPLILIISLHFVKYNFNFNKTFEHLSFSFTLVLLFLGIPLFSAFFAFILSQYSRFSKITVTDKHLIGKNFWGFKNTIPLHDIKKLTNFNHSGIEAKVVNSYNNGQIFILKNTEQYEELIELLKPFLKNDPN